VLYSQSAINALTVAFNIPFAPRECGADSTVTGGFFTLDHPRCFVVVMVISCVKMNLMVAIIVAANTTACIGEKAIISVVNISLWIQI